MRAGVPARLRRPPRPRSEKARTFASLRHFNYRLYFFGQFVSVAGTWMQNVALGWLVLQLTHSGTVLGLTTAARYLPLAVAGPWGGLVADRRNRRSLIITTQLVLFAASALLGLLILGHHVNVAVLVAFTLTIGVISVLDGPGRQSFISELVPRDSLANAIALNSVTLNSARILGPAVGGLVISGLGLAACFLVNALTFLVVVCSLLAMRKSELIPSARESRDRGQIREGLRYVRDTPTLRSALIMVLVLGAMCWEFPVTLPLLASDTFNGSSGSYGAMLSFLGAGAVVGAFLAARRRRSTTRTLAVAAVLWGVVILAAAMAPTLPSALVLLVPVGIGAVTFNSQAKTVLQLTAEPRMRGRVMALWSMAWQGSTFLGAPVVGGLGELAGARYGLLAGALAALIVGGYFLVRTPGEHGGTLGGPAAEHSGTDLGSSSQRDVPA